MRIALATALVRATPAPVASGIHPPEPKGTVAGRATRGKGGVYTFGPRRFDFTADFANRRGAYFWQAVRVACRGGDCRQEGPIVEFRVA